MTEQAGIGGYSDRARRAARVIYGVHSGEDVSVLARLVEDFVLPPDCLNYTESELAIYIDDALSKGS